MTSSVEVGLLSLKTVVEDELGFVVPCYQRPYVWSGTDAAGLFNDIENAWRNGEPHYFIGSVLSTRRTTVNDDRLELIDGQQRMTTLVLLALALAQVQQDQSGLAKVPALGGKPRLEFDIRPGASALLGSYAGLENYSRPGQDEIDRNDYLRHISANLKVLREQVAKLEQSKDKGRSTADFCKYVYTRVRWLNNQVAPQLDLNRLFYSLNMGGIQLQPTDLLKSKLLRVVTDEKPLYRKIWEACENTNNYFERNLRQVFGQCVHGLKFDDLCQYSDEIFAAELVQSRAEEEPTSSSVGMTIEQIHDSKAFAAQPLGASEPPGKQNADEGQTTLFCRSVIGFDLLLIHSLRIFSVRFPEAGLGDVGPRVHKKHLLKSFEALLQKDSDTIKEFLQVLWRVRYQFDRWVAKWRENEGGNGETLQLTSVSLSDNYLSRSPRAISNLVQLQAVRNFTGERSAQYWLTPLLAWLVETGETNEHKVTHKLECIDNQLSLATATQKEASFALAYSTRVEQGDWAEKATYLQQSHGTGFEHYWFQKLEYVLWKRLNQADSTDDKLRRYRITSKNSIEHVHPQHEVHGRMLERSLLDGFGNLALLSPGENSSYSNRPVDVKQALFEDSGKRSYDSLKLKKLFDSFKDVTQWERDGITTHRNEMISLLSEHYAMKCGER